MKNLIPAVIGISIAAAIFFFLVAPNLQK